jgi:hypothetical protein
MKKMLVILFLCFAVTVSAQNNAAEDTTAKPAITAIGKPDGEKIEMKIGKEGGSLTSSDGKMRLIIPAGAVAKKTTFSIQPTTNLMPNGNGKAYRMEPSGINFQQPLQIIFYYTDDDTKGSLPDLLGIAMQDDKGLWSSLNKMTIDTVSKTLNADIRHFSSYVNFSKAKIDPSSAKVKVNGSLRLKITAISTYNSDDDDDLMPLGTEIINSPLWSVNGIPKGNSTTGLISVSRDYSAIYQAPAQIPAQNPVAVTVDFTGSTTTINDKHFKTLRLVSNITVYDNAYEVKMISTMDGGAGSQLGAVKYKDYGSFIISLNENKAKITEVVNKNAELTYIGKCTIVQLKPGQGNINIIGVQSIKLIPAASPKDNPWIEIIFVRSPTILPILQFTCPQPSGGGTYTSNSAAASGIAYGIPAYPQSIKFEAKEGEQTILKLGEEGGPIYVKFTVKQLKDD